MGLFRHPSYPASAGDTDPPLKAGFGVLGLGYLSSFATRRESGAVVKHDRRVRFPSIWALWVIASPCAFPSLHSFLERQQRGGPCCVVALTCLYQREEFLALIFRPMAMFQMQKQVPRTRRVAPMVPRRVNLPPLKAGAETNRLEILGNHFRCMPS
jgi:hypothetical protein